MTTDKQLREFEQLTRPLILWLKENFNPHCKILIDNQCAELVSEEMAFFNDCTGKGKTE